MPRLQRSFRRPMKNATLPLAASQLCRWYSPGSSLGVSSLLHGIALTVIFSLPASPRPPEEPREWAEAAPDEHEGMIVMYLPPVGGGGRGGGGAPGGGGSESPGSGEPQGGLPSGGGAPVAGDEPSAGSGKGLIYPGPQLIESNPPDPTNRFQTLLQPDLQNPPTLEPPLDLPNMVRTPPQKRPIEELFLSPVDVAAIRRARAVDLPAPRELMDVSQLPVDFEMIRLPFQILSRAEPPISVPAPVRVPEIRPEAPDLPTMISTTRPPTLDSKGRIELGVGLANPLRPEDQQPVDPADGLAVVPTQVQLDGPEPPAPPAPPADAEESTENVVSPPETRRVVRAETPGSSSPPAALPAALPTQGKEAETVLALTPVPALPGAAIPAGEARGRFTVGPDSNLDTPSMLPGSPSASGTDSAGAGLEENGDGNTPSGIGSSSGAGSGAAPGTGGSSASGAGGGSGPGTGPGDGSGAGPGSGGGSGSGAGTGAGSGIGPGSGSGSGSGIGSGSGSGPGSGSGSGTGSGTGSGSGSGAGSGAGTGPGTGPFAGIRIVGGAGGKPASGSGLRTGTDRPLSRLKVVGGIGGPENEPSDERPTLDPTPGKYNLQIISTESSGGGLPSFGVFSNEQIRTIYVNMRPEEAQPGPPWILEFALPRKPDAEADDGTEGFVLPVPLLREMPALPPDLVRRHRGEMVIVFGIINEDGRLEQMTVKQTPDSQLDPYILEALSQWDFRPASLDGAGVAVKALLGIPLWLPPE